MQVKQGNHVCLSANKFAPRGLRVPMRPSVQVIVVSVSSLKSAQARIIRVLIPKIPVCDITSSSSSGTGESQVGVTNYDEGLKCQESKHD
jgi:hypothetical protein